MEMETQQDNDDKNHGGREPRGTARAEGQMGKQEQREKRRPERR